MDLPSCSSRSTNGCADQTSPSCGGWANQTRSNSVTAYCQRLIRGTRAVCGRRDDIDATGRASAIEMCPDWYGGTVYTYTCLMPSPVLLLATLETFPSVFVSSKVLSHRSNEWQQDICKSNEIGKAFSDDVGPRRSERSYRGESSPAKRNRTTYKSVVQGD